jgi:peptidyl-prolyl cis-trans isomerase C
VPALLAAPVAALAQDKPILTINGRAITEADLRHVEAEIGHELAGMPEESRRRVMIEFLVQNELLAGAAEAEKLGQGAGFDAKVAYYRRRALRDVYFEKRIKDGIAEAEVRKAYDQQATLARDNPQVRARHILVDSESEAREIREKIAHGGGFAELARKHSKDPGSGAQGGDLGYLKRGQTVKSFDETIFRLVPGDISEPVKSEFGWHIIKVEDRRALPPYEGMREQIVAGLVQQRTQALSEELRKAAKIEYIDPVLKKAVEAEAGGMAPRR